LERQYNHLNKKLDALQKKKYSHNQYYNLRTKQETKFYTRMNNLSHITFTREELNTLNFGFQHSIEKPVTPYLTNIAIETENAIKLLDTNIQGAYRVLATKKLKQIINSRNSCNPLHKRKN
jgi:predicted Ser/Thr protein kinase